MMASVGPDGWEMKHSPYTPEGSVESAGKFARAGSARPRSPAVRRFAILLVVALVGPLAATIVGVLVVTAVGALFR